MYLSFSYLFLDFFVYFAKSPIHPNNLYCQCGHNLTISHWHLLFLLRSEIQIFIPLIFVLEKKISISTCSLTLHVYKHYLKPHYRTYSQSLLNFQKLCSLLHSLCYSRQKKEKKKKNYKNWSIDELHNLPFSLKVKFWLNFFDRSKDGHGGISLNSANGLPWSNGLCDCFSDMDHVNSFSLYFILSILNIF